MASSAAASQAIAEVAANLGPEQANLTNPFRTVTPPALYPSETVVEAGLLPRGSIVLVAFVGVKPGSQILFGSVVRAGALNRTLFEASSVEASPQRPVHDISLSWGGLTLKDVVAALGASRLGIFAYSWCILSAVAKDDLSGSTRLYGVPTSSPGGPLSIGTYDHLKSSEEAPSFLNLPSLYNQVMAQWPRLDAALKRFVQENLWPLLPENLRTEPPSLPVGVLEHLMGYTFDGRPLAQSARDGAPRLFRILRWMGRTSWALQSLNGVIFDSQELENLHTDIATAALLEWENPRAALLDHILDNVGNIRFHAPALSTASSPQAPATVAASIS